MWLSAPSSRQFNDFFEGTQPILGPYRDVRGNPITQWGQLVKRQIIASESNGLVPFPSQTSFATREENQIIVRRWSREWC